MNRFQLMLVFMSFNLLLVVIFLTMLMPAPSRSSF